MHNWSETRLAHLRILSVPGVDVHTISSLAYIKFFCLFLEPFFLHVKVLQGFLLSNHKTSIIWFVLSWLWHEPAYNCTCNTKKLVHRALLSSTTLPHKLLEMMHLCCLSVWHCPWQSCKHMENGKLLQKAWLVSWQKRRRGYNGTHNNYPFEWGLNK